MRYKKWFSQYKITKSYDALQRLADKLESDSDSEFNMRITEMTASIALREIRIIGGVIYGDLSRSNEHGMTALHLAAWYNADKALKVILSRPEVEVNKANMYGVTALHMAVTKRSLLSLNELLQRDDIDVNKETEKGETALYWAASLRIDNIIKILMMREDIKIDDKTEFVVRKYMRRREDYWPSQ